MLLPAYLFAVFPGHASIEPSPTRLFHTSNVGTDFSDIDTVFCRALWIAGVATSATMQLSVALVLRGRQVGQIRSGLAQNMTIDQ